VAAIKPTGNPGELCLTCIESTAGNFRVLCSRCFAVGDPRFEISAQSLDGVTDWSFMANTLNDATTLFVCVISN